MNDSFQQFIAKLTDEQLAALVIFAIIAIAVLLPLLWTLFRYAYCRILFGAIGLMLIINGFGTANNIAIAIGAGLCILAVVGNKTP